MHEIRFIDLIHTLSYEESNTRISKIYVANVVHSLEPRRFKMYLDDNNIPTGLPTGEKIPITTIPVPKLCQFVNIWNPRSGTIWAQLSNPKANPSWFVEKIVPVIVHDPQYGCYPALELYVVNHINYNASGKADWYQPQQDGSNEG